MEAKYTKLLTQEFCVGWAKQHLTKNGLQVVLSVNPNPQFDGTRLYELQLEVIEDDVLMPRFRSRLCCLIFALDVEPTLKQSLSEGKGVNIFVK